MTRPIISVDGLSKQYRIGARQEPYGNLRESLTRAARAPFNRMGDVYRNTRAALRKQTNGKAPPLVSSQLSNTIWALKDVSFEVHPGEVLGIIGHNGAGKSTLLKVLSRITEPTAGRVDLYGRVGSLLEVGTGFHPELTGRENIYLNGIILGMRRGEITRKFDEIVDFSGVDKFLDTPIKRYSTGMQVRLAFAVAAHLDPEILIIDEVLAVGDAEFQSKCLGKMREVARGGRTILFVTHQIAAVRNFCSRAVNLKEGRIVCDGTPADVLNVYLGAAATGPAAERRWDNPAERPGDQLFRLHSVRSRQESGDHSDLHRSSEPLRISMEFDLSAVDDRLVVGFDLIHDSGVVVLKSCHNDGQEEEWPNLKLGHNCLTCTIPAGLLSGGSYYVAPRVYVHRVRWIINGEPAIKLEVLRDHSASPFWLIESVEKFNGVIAPCLPWDAT